MKPRIWGWGKPMIRKVRQYWGLQYVVARHRPYTRQKYFPTWREAIEHLQMQYRGGWVKR